MPLTAKEFLALGAIRTVTIAVEGGDVTVRELSVADRGAILALRQTDPARVPALVVRLCALNNDGSPMFTEADDEAIVALRPSLVDAVATAVMRLGGMMAAAEGDEKKD